jgi:hypothetical protein
VAEQIILAPVRDQLLAPEMIAEMVTDMRTYYDAKLAEQRSQQERRPAEVEEVDRRIARLKDRLRNGDPDLSAEELQAVIAKAEAKRNELLSAQPEAKRMDTILRALPAAAAQYRTQIDKGLQGNPTEAGRARVAVRKLLGDRIDLVPAKGGGHLVAHLEFQRAALLAGSVGSVGSGGAIWSRSMGVFCFSDKNLCAVVSNPCGTDPDFRCSSSRNSRVAGRAASTRYYRNERFACHRQRACAGIGSGIVSWIMDLPAGLGRDPSPLVARLQCTRDRYSDIAADERFAEHIDHPCGLRALAQLRTTVAAHEYG